MLLVLAATMAQANDSAHEAAEYALRQRDFARAAQIWQKLVQAGDKKAAFRLAGLYRSGRGVARNPEQARLLLELATKAGYDSGRAHAALRRPEPNERRSPASLRSAIEQGDIRAVRAVLDAGTVPNAPVSGARCNAAEAIVRGHADILELLVARGAELETCGGSGLSLLHEAIRVENVEAVEALLRLGARVDARAPGNATPLHAAIRVGHGGIAKRLIQAGHSLSARDDAGRNPLDLAIVARKPQIAKHLRTAGARRTKPADPDKRAASGWLEDAAAELSTRAYRGWPPLSVAAWRGHDAVVTRVLAGGADPNELDPEGAAALARAASSGHFDIVRALLIAGADPNHGTPAPLVAAAASNDDRLLRTLLDAGARIDTVDPSRRSAVHLATAAGRRATVETLLERGARADRIDADGLSPLEVAVRHAHDDLVELLAARTPQEARSRALCTAAARGRVRALGLLLETGLDAEGTCANGQPLLHVATRRGSAQAVGLLLRAGAQSNRPSASGNSALLVAAEAGKPDIVVILLARGGAVDSRGLGGRTPLMRAAAAGHREVAEHLLAARADLRMRDEQGNTALDLARSAGHEPLITLLEASPARGWFD
ncbi:MAG: ankyrin repeat domain-containing protein [Myxococcales bacterium]|nr:ankyrin repeat domain-containing protein [Myxococcales bacterium]